MDNSEAIQAGKNLFESYHKETPFADKKFLLSCMITDILHYAKSENLDVEYIVERAKYHFHAERG